jgi:hypothetical protein
VDTVKWSVRGVDLESIRKLREVKSIGGGGLGELVSEAIDFWFDCLETDDEEASEADNLQPQVGQNITHLGNDVASLSHEIKS